MESFPPSYCPTTAQDPWPLVAPYLPTETLLNVLKVSKKMHENLSPFLWGDPASHSPISAREGFRNPRSTAFRFIVSLSWTKLSMRELVHTIRIGRSSEETNVSGSSTWLRLIVKALPNLQSLDLSGSRNADHLALSELKGLLEDAHEDATSGAGGTGKIGDGLGVAPGLQVKLLSLNGCPNITPSSLAAALGNLPSLIYLDLSNTSSAHHANAIASLAKLPDLRILSMSNTGLDSDAVLRIGESTTYRLLSLDLSNNPKLNNDVLARLQMTGHPPVGSSFQQDPGDADAASRHQAIVSLAKIGDIRAEAYRALTTALKAHLLIESVPSIGLAQLDVSTTNISVDAAYTIACSDGWMSFDCSDIQPDSYTQPISNETGTNPEIDEILGANPARHLRMPASIANLLANDLTSFPHLRKLILTDVPTYSASMHLSEALINLIRAVAERAHFAAQKLSPLRDSLQEITIEVSRPGFSARHSKRLLGYTPYQLRKRATDQGLRDSGWRSSTLSSVTEDRDSDNTWRNAEQDFSFFDENADSDMYAKSTKDAPRNRSRAGTATSGRFDGADSVRSSASSGLENWCGVAAAVPSVPERKSPFVGLQQADEKGHEALSRVDIVKEIREWRLGVKREMETRGRWVPGYWPGKITIIRIGDN